MTKIDPNMKATHAYLSAITAALAASVFLISAIGASYSGALAQQQPGSNYNNNNNNINSVGDPASKLNQTALPPEEQQQQLLQNKTNTCAPQFNGTMISIPRPNEANNTGTTSSAIGQQQQNRSGSINNSTLIVDIMSLARQNTCYREELKTANHTQVVLMNLKPGEEIGLEVHKRIDQLLIFVQGSGMANISGHTYPVKAGDLVFIPAGTVHNFVNTGNTDLKLFTTYSPPNHLPGTLQKTKADEKGYVPQGAIEEEG